MAVAGIQVEVADGFARIEFLNPDLRGTTLTQLIRIGGKLGVRPDTGGLRKGYTVREEVARAVGLID